MSRAATEAVLRGYADKVIRCDRAAAVAALTRHLGDTIAGTASMSGPEP